MSVLRRLYNGNQYWKPMMNRGKTKEIYGYTMKDSVEEKGK